jgi:uncharacterized membrane protein SpoIIM required for sporulation
VDIDAYVAAHAGEWYRLEQLVNRRRLTGFEADELVALYQRAATHLSVIQTRSPDPVLVSRLSTLVARGRSAVAGGSSPAWKEVSRFFTVTFPMTVYRARRWWLGAMVLSYALAFLMMAYVAGHPEIWPKLGTPDELKQLVNHDFQSYYSEHPAQDFALEVWTNNAFVAGATLISGVTLIFPIYLLLDNAINLGVVGGLMIGHGRADLFWGLIIPHGLLELTAVFVAAGMGLKMGWSWVDPGPLPRSWALARAGREAILGALGLIVVLAVSGAIEAFVTPSGLPTWARIAVGVLAETAFMLYVFGWGRRADKGAESADLGIGLREDQLPVA